MEKFDVLYRSFDSKLFLDEMPVSLSEMFQNYAMVKVGIEADGLEDLFYKLNMTDWNDGNEVRDVVFGHRISHTSMSVGDIAIDKSGIIWMCSSFGFKKVQFISFPE